MLIVDADAAAATLVTGSYNFTSAAQFRNAENVLIIRNYPALAQAYRDNLPAPAVQGAALRPATPDSRAGRRRCRLHDLPACTRSK